MNESPLSNKYSPLPEKDSPVRGKGRKLSLVFLWASLTLACAALLCLFAETKRATAEERTVERFLEEQVRVCKALLSSQERLCDLFKKRLEREKKTFDSAAKEVERVRNKLASFEKELLSRSKELKQTLQESYSSLYKALSTELRPQRNIIEENKKSLEIMQKRLEGDYLLLKKRVLYPTVQLRGNGTVGSGVLVYSKRLVKKPLPLNIILTAYHVVLEVTPPERKDRLDNVRLMGPDDKLLPERFSASVLTFDPKKDLALLQLSSKRTFPYVAHFISPLESKKLELFEPAYAVGCPLGNMPLATWGQITNKNKEVGGQIFWMLSAPTHFGNSGGGIYRAKDGLLIGIASMIYTYGRKNPTVVPHLGLFVPPEEIFSFLKEEGFEFIFNPQRAVPPHIAALCLERGNGKEKPAEAGQDYGSKKKDDFFKKMGNLSNSSAHLGR